MGSEAKNKGEEDVTAQVRFLNGEIIQFGHEEWDELISCIEKDKKNIAKVSLYDALNCDLSKDKFVEIDQDGKTISLHVSMYAQRWIPYEKISNVPEIRKKILSFLQSPGVPKEWVWVLERVHLTPFVNMTPHIEALLIDDAALHTDFVKKVKEFGQK